MKRALIIGIWMLALLLFLPVSAGAKDHLGFRAELSRDQCFQGETVDLTLDYDGSVGEVSALVAELEYDAGCWELVHGDEISDGYVSTVTGNGFVRWIYSFSEGENLFHSGGMKYTFKAVAPASGGSFKLDLSQGATADGRIFDPEDFILPVEVLTPPDSLAGLLSLAPSSGTLTPDFSPEVEAYRISVPYEVTEMHFSARTLSGGSYRVNRKNLGAGGTETEFTITVTAEDGKTKRAYMVTVYREMKPAVTPKPTATPKPSGTPKPTATPKPSKTPKPTATPKPSQTPKPTAAPKPSQTPKPTATPKPSQTPKPTATPKSSKTPKPTATPKPSRTPKPTASPTPREPPVYLGTSPEPPGDSDSEQGNGSGLFHVVEGAPQNSSQNLFIIGISAFFLTVGMIGGRIAAKIRREIGLGRKGPKDSK